jgi:CrcB protein
VRLPIDPDLPAATRGNEASVLAAVAVGGFIGAIGRYELGLAWPTPAGGIPWSTFTINTSGAFLLGVTVVAMAARGQLGNLFRPFFCVGVLGAWTTMSTFAVEADLLVKDGHPAHALIYLAVTLVAGLGLTWLGAVTGRWISR